LGTEAQIQPTDTKTRHLPQKLARAFRSSLKISSHQSLRAGGTTQVSGHERLKLLRCDHQNNALG